jgi:MoxR-like ATPase
MTDVAQPTEAVRSSDHAREALLQVRREVAKAVVGQDAAVSGMLIALLSRGHILLEGVPGVAKTLLVRSLAAALDIQTKRVQFTPDLMPGDITGSLVYDPHTAEFSFREGPVFTNLLLADEINRTPPKTQASLLESMEERQVSVDGEPRALPSPFLVAATQNPVEYEGTYPLPEAQLDRFLLKVELPLPPREDEVTVLQRHAAGFDPRDLRAAGLRQSAPSRSPPRSPATSSTSPAPPVRRRPCRWASAPAVRRRCWPPAARGRGSTAAASSPPTTSRRSPTPPWRTGCRCGPRPSSRGSTWARCWPARSRPSPFPGERGSADGWVARSR